MSKRTIVFAAASGMAGVVRAVTRIAPSDATVLLTGETGTGKEVMARLVHENSGRASQPFVPVNCAAIPESLIESELFGHVKGAFTGATTNRRGRLAAAEGGTLFLDEVGELSLSMQVKLLRVLQERAYEPVGSNESVSANFRLVAATNRDLALEVEMGRFRRDLYYRLMVCPLELPPLRERPGDVVQLFKHFWAQRGETRPIEQRAFEILEKYTWPGNVRELENLVERVSVCCEHTSVRPEDLPWQVTAIALGPGAAPPRPSAPSLATAHAAAPEPMKAAVSFPSGTVVDVPVAPPEPSPMALASPAPLAPPPPLLPLASAAPLPPVTAPTAAPPPSAMPGVPASVPPVAIGAEATGPASHLLRALTLPLDLPTLLRQVEESLIDAALAHTEGNRKAAAEMLGLQRTTLVEKLRRRQKDVPTPDPATAASAAGLS